MLDQLDPGPKIKKKAYKAEIERLQLRLASLQARAREAGLPVILVFEGLETAGKATCVRTLAAGLDPHWLQVQTRHRARQMEAVYPWMRSYWLNLPPRGSWAIFHRSWYQRVLDDRLEGNVAERAWRQAYRDILEFERTLSDDGYLLVKYFLHLSDTELAQRLRKEGRRASSEARADQRRYTEWLQACEEMLAHTDTKWAPWNLVAARRKRHLRLQVASLLVETLERKLGLPVIEVAPATASTLADTPANISATAPASVPDETKPAPASPAEPRKSAPRQQPATGAQPESSPEAQT